VTTFCEFSVELNMNLANKPSREQCLFLSLAFSGTPSSVDTFTMAEKLSSAFSHEERTMNPETTMSPKTISTGGVSFLTNTYKQFANKSIQDCIKDGFPASFLHCQYPQAAESSINADVSTPEPGRSYLQAADGLGSISLPSSYGEYADVQIGVICNYAPDDELDDNGNPTLHFQLDTNGNFYNVTMRNLFTTMQTMMTRAVFLPDVAMLILLATVVVVDMCMLMGPTTGWSETKEYHFLSQCQLPSAKNIIAYVLSKCENLVGVMVFGQKAYDNILPWIRTHYSQKFLIQNVFLSHAACCPAAIAVVVPPVAFVVPPVVVLPLDVVEPPVVVSPVAVVVPRVAVIAPHRRAARCRHCVTCHRAARCRRLAARCHHLVTRRRRCAARCRRRAASL
jgi:hypothetical protein